MFQKKIGIFMNSMVVLSMLCDLPNILCDLSSHGYRFGFIYQYAQDIYNARTQRDNIDKYKFIGFHQTEKKYSKPKHLCSSLRQRTKKLPFQRLKKKEKKYQHQFLYTM